MLPYCCQIKDEDGYVEETTNAASVAECVQWFSQRGIDFTKVVGSERGDVSYFTVSYYPSNYHVKGFIHHPEGQ